MKAFLDVLFWTWIAGASMAAVFSAFQWATTPYDNGGVMGGLPRDLAIVGTYVFTGAVAASLVLRWLL